MISSQLDDSRLISYQTLARALFGSVMIYARHVISVAHSSGTNAETTWKGIYRISGRNHWTSITNGQKDQCRSKAFFSKSFRAIVTPGLCLAGRERGLRREREHSLRCDTSRLGRGGLERGRRLIGGRFNWRIVRILRSRGRRSLVSSGTRGHTEVATGRRKMSAEVVLWFSGHSC